MKEEKTTTEKEAETKVKETKKQRNLQRQLSHLLQKAKNINQHLSRM